MLISEYGCVLGIFTEIPDKDGNETGKAIQARVGLHKTCLLRDWSGFPMSEQPAESRAPGMNVARDFRTIWRDQPFHRYLGIELDEQRQGFSRIRLQTSERTPTGAGGGVHGGVLATLVDLACISAVATIIGPNELMAGTAELN